jgi:hypothetical protein
MPAGYVEIVWYSHATLLEPGSKPSTDADWEIVSINASLNEEEMPMPVETLIRNHFKEAGGTTTGMSDSEFVKALKKSREFWSNKAMAAASK